MREIPNNLFGRERTYDNSIIRHRGLVVARTFSSRLYLNKKGENEIALLPEIIICQASKEAPIQINGRGIIAKSPAPSYALQFNPMWGEKYEKGKEAVYKFENAFIPEEKDEIGNIIVYKHNLTGLYNDKIIPGEINFSSIENRDISLSGKMNELEMMLKVVMDSIPSKGYGLESNFADDKIEKRYYKINISEEDINKFAKDVSYNIF